MNTINIFVCACLIFVSLVYSIDVLGINGILPRIVEHFAISDSQTALLQTATSIVHTGTLVLVWLFGDSFKRRKLYFASVSLWIILSLLAPILGSGSFLVFVSLRALSAIPATVFTVLVPVIMADLFTDRALGIALACLYLGDSLSGMTAMTLSSWIVTSNISWQTALIAVPILAIVPLICLFFANKTLRKVEQADRSVGKSFAGVFSILTIKSYVLLTATLAITGFHNAGYPFWFPSMYLIVYENIPDLFLGLAFPAVNMINVVVVFAGMAVGFLPIMSLAANWRHGTGVFSGRAENLRAYPIVVTLGSLLNSIMFVSSILLLDKSYVACVVVSFFSGFAAAADVSLTQQMVLMVVPSSHRASGVAFYKLVAGVAAIPSAQLIGMGIDLFRGDSELPLDRFGAFQKAMLCESTLLLASLLLFVAVAYYFPRDFRRAEAEDSEEEKTSLLDKTDISRASTAKIDQLSF